MRLWSIHPKYLDTKGLVALWREAILAKKVLEGKTKGYKNHPQLERFRESSNPISAINLYLNYIFEESLKRNYNFDNAKLTPKKEKFFLNITEGQLIYEFAHLKNKLKTRDKKRFQELLKVNFPKENPFFKKIKGDKEEWEKG